VPGQDLPDEVGCVVEPRLAERMIERALPDLPEDRVWVAADEVYSRDGAFHAFWNSGGRRTRLPDSSR
jgi:hypothetical protein